ncbi:hypothetical protein ACQEVB_21905 [Pseudonocardia sp. CA-107938]|uniref:hypothetical protein n=1 Tax=Pseudonocardia sp. CA-107938 TaxID=3240021 RepID=UPI003D8B03E6
MRLLVRLLVALVAVAVVAALAVVAVDAWRSWNVRPDDCGTRLLDPARGDQRADAGLVAGAWSALVENDGAAGGLDGSRPVLDRSCLAYAGHVGPDGASTVVFLETTRTGATELLRIAEVRLGGAGPRRAAVGYPVVVGNEVAAGVVLPLSGHYLAPVDVTAVQVIGAGAPAGRVADGVFDLGVVPDRTLGPAEQVPDTAATLLLDRSVPSAPDLVALPVVSQQDAPPIRVPFAVTVDGAPRADPAVRPAVLAVLPPLYADPRLPSLLGSPALDVRTAVLPGGHGVTVAGARPTPGLPVFRYFVPAVGPVVAAVPAG